MSAEESDSQIQEFWQIYSFENYDIAKNKIPTQEIDGFWQNYSLENIDLVKESFHCHFP